MKLRDYWVAAKELDSSQYIAETISIYIYIYIHNDYNMITWFKFLNSNPGYELKLC